MTKEQQQDYVQYIEDLLFDISLLAESGMPPNEQNAYFERESTRALALIVDPDQGFVGSAPVRQALVWGRCASPFAF